MKRVQSNIVNIGFTIMNEQHEVKDGQGRNKKTKAQGVELTQAIVNGKNAGVGLRTINGAQKSAQIKLDTQALTDLRDALNEVLDPSASQS